MQCIGDSPVSKEHRACLVSAWQAGYRPGSNIPPQAVKSDGLGSFLAQAAVARVQTKHALSE